jgi:hypothetical protein
MLMRMWRLACGAIALVIFSQGAFADDEIGERFIIEYKKSYPGEKWELIGTVKMVQAGAVGRSGSAETIRVFFNRASENTIRTAACTKTREKDWVCEVGQNLPEGSLVLK